MKCLEKKYSVSKWKVQWMGLTEDSVEEKISESEDIAIKSI